MPKYNKPVRALMHDMISDMQIVKGQIISKEQIVLWFKQRYPNIKDGTIGAHLGLMSTNAPSRIHHHPKSDGSDDLFFKIDANHFRLYDPLNDPVPITITSAIVSAEIQFEQIESNQEAHVSEFAYEHDLRDYLAKNLSLIEPGLKLYQEEGITGIEFPVGGRFIDILAVAKDGGYLVIELKVSKGYDRVVGQLLRYMGWIEKHHADPSQTVRGAIVAKTISEDLKLACSKIPNVKLFEYSLSVALEQVEAN